MDDANLKDMTTEQLWEALKTEIDNLYRGVVKVGQLTLELESRGQKPSKRYPVTRWAREVALGNLTREAYVAFSGLEYLVKAVMSLPVAVQLKLVEDPMVSVCVLAGEKTTERRISVLDLDSRAVKTVIDSERHVIRTVAEQAVILNMGEIKEMTKRPTYSHDPETGILHLNGYYAGPQLLAYLKKHRLI